MRRRSSASSRSGSRRPHATRFQNASGRPVGSTRNIRSLIGFLLPVSWRPGPFVDFLPWRGHISDAIVGPWHRPSDRNAPRRQLARARDDRQRQAARVGLRADRGRRAATGGVAFRQRAVAVQVPSERQVRVGDCRWLPRLHDQAGPTHAHLRVGVDDRRAGLSLTSRTAPDSEMACAALPLPGCHLVGASEAAMQATPRQATGRRQCRRSRSGCARRAQRAR